ncbi:MAG: preprotein translocase subunit SecE [Chitinispirillaceae bacterium]|jgi:preprotein translocase subunit SecE
MQKLLQYLKDVRSEMLKVTWPTWNELTGGTILVIILSIILAVFVKLCDMGIGSLLKLLLQSSTW